VFGLDTCGNAEEINFPNSDNVTSFLPHSVVLYEEGKVPCVDLEFVGGGETVYRFKFFESARGVSVDANSRVGTCGSRLDGQTDGGGRVLFFLCRL
jgi:hypothetical protein